LYESGKTLDYVYFPIACIVSLQFLMEDGASADIAVIGCEGLVGIALFMGGETTPSDAVVQSPGHGYRLSSASLKSEIENRGALQRLALRYTQALITQIAQTAVCSRYHSVEQQLCRRLLQRLDLLPSSEPRMTLELIADGLGFRREGVTEAVERLQKAGSIEYSSKHIVVVDRVKLETHVCECYAVVKKEYDRLLTHL
jgi:CRP-like cAMP-binding protein